MLNPPLQSSGKVGVPNRSAAIQREKEKKKYIGKIYAEMQALGGKIKKNKKGTEVAVYFKCGALP